MCRLDHASRRSQAPELKEQVIRAGKQAATGCRLSATRRLVLQANITAQPGTVPSGIRVLATPAEVADTSASLLLRQIEA